jgi:hypothetical protein
MIVFTESLWAMFKIKVFNALQTRSGPSKHPFKTQPQIENEDVT